MYEYMALMNLDNFIKSYTNKTSSPYSNNKFKYFLKNVKFIEKPNFDCIIDQMNVLDKNKSEIVNKLEFIDLKFTL